MATGNSGGLLGEFARSKKKASVINKIVRKIEHAKKLITRLIGMLRMDEVNKIRKKFFVKGETRGKIAKSCRRSWDTVNRIVNMNREDLENRGKRTTRQKVVMTDNVIKAT